MPVSLPSALHSLLEVYQRYFSASQKKSEMHLERKSDGFLPFIQISKQLVKLISTFADPFKAGSNKPSKHKPESPNDALLIIFSLRKARSMCFTP